MGHLMYRRTPVCSDVLTQKETDWFQLSRRNFPEQFIHRGRLCSAAAVVRPFRPSAERETGQERGGEEEKTKKKLPFSSSFPTQSPLLLPGEPPPPTRLSLSAKSRRQRDEPWGRHLYRVLIPWLFLQFLNFKWEYWNTDIDMKWFIVTISHYYHRPYCYPSDLVQSVCCLTAEWR